jgi:predicted site-specific integrase-resolvase
MTTNKEFICPKEAVKILNVHSQTLYKYEKEGLIETLRTPGGKRLYNIKDYLIKNTASVDIPKKKICYCRVSTHGQKNDLERQIDYIKTKYPNHEIIKDIGSGINFKRKGLIKIINYAITNQLDELVITHKDRLCRIGYELIEMIIKTHSNGKIIIEEDVLTSPEEEITKDLIQIITVFSDRVHGLRSYKKSLKNDF